MERELFYKRYYGKAKQRVDDSRGKELWKCKVDSKILLWKSQRCKEFSEVEPGENEQKEGLVRASVRNDKKELWELPTS